MERRLSRKAPVVSTVAALVLALSAQLVPAFSSAPPTPSVQATVASGATSGPDAGSVNRLYRAYFLRTPDRSGLAYWEAKRASGMPLAQISDLFAGSAEFQARYGSLDDGAFVRLVYRNVLFRSPDAGGFAHWTGALRAGLSRGGMMIGFSDSAEFKNKVNATTKATPAPTVPSGSSSSYAFTLVDGTEPVRWAPCAPIRVVANFAGAPAGAEAAVRSAVDALSAAHGIRWVYEGETSERYDSKDATFRRPATQARYGTGYAPVLISWPTTWPAGDTAVGYGGFASVADGPARRAVTGAVALKPGFAPNQETLANLVLHELGHVANLAHAPTTDQVMSATLNGKDRYQAGDLAGLRKVGGHGASCAGSVTEVGALEAFAAPSGAAHAVHVSDEH